MALIRHNTRPGERQPGHFAHDTTRHDTSGTWCSGKAEKVFTSKHNPCPSCGGYGELLEIDQLPRSTYPAGSVVPTINLVKQDGPTGYSNYQPGSLPDTWGENDVEPEIVGAWSEATGEPVSVLPPTCQACGSSHDVQSDGICKRCRDDERARNAVALPPKREVSVPETDSKVSDASKAIADLLGIQSQIETAIATVRSDVQHDTQTAIVAGIELLKGEFQEAVKSIIAPKTIVIENRNVPDATPKTIVGAHKAFERCLRWLEARDRKGHTKNLFLVGPTGSGKTTLAMQLAEALGVEFYTTGQVLGEHQVTGFKDANGNYHETPFYVPFKDGGLWLGDEFDGWSPEAALSMNAALANGVATFPESVQPVERNSMFYCIVAGNTWGKGSDRDYVGRNQMDAASLRRYVKIFVDYDKELEQRIAADHNEYLHIVWTARDRARELNIRETFSTGEIEMGCDALNAGMELREVVDTILRRDIKDAEWNKLSVAA